MNLFDYWIFALMVGIPAFLLSYFVTKMISASSVGMKGKIPSIQFKIKSYTIHLHHWFLSLIASLFVIRYNAIFSITQFTILFSSMLGITVHGIKNYSDWKGIIRKK